MMHTTEGGNRVDTHRVMARDQWASDAELADMDAEDELLASYRFQSRAARVALGCIVGVFLVLLFGGWLPGGA